MIPLYVSFHTAGPYGREAAELAATLAAHDLPWSISHIPCAGSWVRNCAAKADFIHQEVSVACLNGEGPIVWLDADARVRKPPTLFDSLDCDFAAHWWRDVELISATLYFAPTEAALYLLDAWHALCVKRPDEWDQRILQEVVDGGRIPGLRVTRLPPEYCWIDGGAQPDLSERAYGKREPVIQQTQASRRWKHAVQSPHHT